MIFILANN